MNRNKLAALMLSFVSPVGLTACGGRGGGGGATDVSGPENPTQSSTVTVSVRVAGLRSSASFSLNGSSSLDLSEDGTFSFSSQLSPGSDYTVEVTSQPSSPIQTCVVANHAGKVGNADVVLATICVDQTNDVHYIETTVQVDPTLPSSVTDRVSTVLSGFESSSLNSSLVVPMRTDGTGAIIFALDAQGKMIFAGNASNAVTTLGYESTALALAQLVVPDLIGLTPKELATTVAGASEYQHLVSLISSTIASGGSILDSDAVLLSLDEVTSQLVLPGSSELSPKAVTVTAQALATKRVTADLPADILGEPPYRSVQLTNLDYSAEYITLINEQSIAWEVSTSTADGTPICENDGTCAARLPPSDLLSIIDPPEAQLPFAGESFNITLQQDNASRAENLGRTTTDLISLMFRLATLREPSALQECIDVAANDVLRPAVKDLAGTSFQDFSIGRHFSDAVWKQLLSTLALRPSLLSSCGLGIEGLDGYGSTVADVIWALAGVLPSEVAAAVDGISFSQEFASLVHYWNAMPASVGVCLGVIPGIPDATLQLTNCSASFRFTPDVLYLANGASADFPMLEALDQEGDKTVPPPEAKLDITPIDPTIATVDLSSRQVTACPGCIVGKTTVNVSYPPTGASGEYDVEVVVPKILLETLAGPVDPHAGPAPKIYVGTTPLVRLDLYADVNLNPVHVPPGTHWQIDPSDAAQVGEFDTTGVIGPFTPNFSGLLTVTALEPGRTFGYDSIQLDIVPKQCPSSLIGTWNLVSLPNEPTVPPDQKYCVGDPNYPQPGGTGYVTRGELDFGESDWMETWDWQKDWCNADYTGTSSWSGTYTYDSNSCVVTGLSGPAGGADKASRDYDQGVDRLTIWGDLSEPYVFERPISH